MLIKVNLLSKTPNLAKKYCSISIPTFQKQKSYVLLTGGGDKFRKQLRSWNMHLVNFRQKYLPFKSVLSECIREEVRECFRKIN